MIVSRCCALLAIVSCCAASPTLAAKRGEVVISVVDSKTNQPVAVRMHLKDQKGKTVKPPETVFWHDHFAVDGSIKLTLPQGNYTFEMERGLEYKTRSGQFFLEDGASDSKEVTMERFLDSTDEGWYSGDLHVHRPADGIELAMRADDLHIAPLVSWSTKLAPPKSFDSAPVKFDRNRFYQLFAGRDEREGSGLLFFHLAEPLALHGAAKEYPASVEWLTKAKQSREAFGVAEKANAWDLPAWIAAGGLDAVLVANLDSHRDGFAGKEATGKPREGIAYQNATGMGRWSQDMYFHLLNCGLQIPPAAGSGSGIAPSPIGYNRVYVHCDGELTWDKWWNNLRLGKVVVTNGPIMQPKVDGKLPGHVFQAAKGTTLDLSISLNLSTREKIHYLEVIQNGVVVHEVRLDKWAENNGVLPPVKFSESGWLMVRAVTDNATTYRYAMSGPFYVDMGYKPRISKKSAQFLYDWVVQRAKQIKLADPTQREEVIAFHRNARDYWKSILDDANAE